MEKLQKELSHIADLLDNTQNTARVLNTEDISDRIEVVRCLIEDIREDLKA